MLKPIENLFNLKAFQEDLRKIGVNFITAGIVGVFINHFVGSRLATMVWAAFWVTCAGLVFLAVGLLKFGSDNK